MAFALTDAAGNPLMGTTRVEASPGPGVLRFEKLAAGSYYLADPVFIFCSFDAGETVLARAVT